VAGKVLASPVRVSTTAGAASSTIDAPRSLG
jgi:hypothetical protein